MGRLLAALAAAALLATALLLPTLREFRVEASTESLVLESDPDLRAYETTQLLFTSDEFVLVGLTRDDLFTPAGVAAVSSLHAAFEEIEGVESVQSIVSVPLLRSFAGFPPSPFVAMARQATLEDPAVDLEKAREELTDHALFAQNLISSDGRTAGVLVTLVARPEVLEVQRQWQARVGVHHAARQALEAARARGAPQTELAPLEQALSAAGAELEAYRPSYTASEDARKAERLQIVRAVREVVQAQRAAGADVSVSGVPSIIVEMVEAIEQDLELFSGLSLAFLVVFLLLVFRRLRWVVLPLLAAGAAVVVTLGLMLLAGRRVTVITANLPSLLLVIGLAHSIHLIVWYRELLALMPDVGRGERLFPLVRRLFWPCLFTATTTAVGFASLYFAGSRPIIDFGYFMALGVGVALVFSFTIVPAGIWLLPGADEGRMERSARVLQVLGRASLRRPGVVAGLTVLLCALSTWGTSRIEFEARFIDYFQPTSPIHRGLTFVDRRLGGTSGLEVVLAGEAGAFGPAHPEHLEAAHEVEAWLRARPEVGAVMSYVGLLDEVLELPGIPASADRRMASLLFAQLLDQGQIDPATLRPYVVVEPTEVGGREYAPYSAVRIVARVRETDPDLARGALRADLERFLAERFPADGPLEATPSGMFVLYHNMLRSLKGSLVASSLISFGAIWLMLSLLFRHPGAGLLAMLPNVVPILLVLGAMGWTGVPLDMATVMIASVALGIGVDCAIHYLFRYRDEVGRDGDVEAALLRSHGSIGTSIVYTSLTSVVGFAVLVVSGFRPNAYFGLLTGFAMVAALFTTLTLLPVLVRWTGLFRPRAGLTPSG